MVLDASKMERVSIILSKNRQFNTNQMIQYFAIAYAFVLPLSRAGISFFTALLFFLWIIDGNVLNKIKQIFKSQVVRVLILFITFYFLSLLWADNVTHSLHYIQRHWHILPLFVLMFSIKKEYIPKVLSAFILGMFISEIISYGVFFELWHIGKSTPENPSPFMHHIEYSIFLAFTALILLSRIFNEMVLKYKLFYIFFFITISGNLFLNAGRTGQFAFILGLFVLAFLKFENKLKALFISSILTIMILGIAFNISETFQSRIILGKKNIVHVIEDKDYCTSWGGRVGAWIISKDIIVEHPLVGAGLVDNMKLFHQIIDTKYPEMKCMHKDFHHIHNQFLQILTQSGLIGLAIFLTIFYMIFKIPLKNKEYQDIKYIYLTVLFFSFMAEVVFPHQFSMTLFALIIGLLLAQHRIENEV